MTLQSRRQFLIASGLTLGAQVGSVIAQTLTHARVGHMTSGVKGTPDGGQAIADRLRQLGWIEGRNLTFERRFGEGKAELLAKRASELVDLKMDVIVVWTTGVADVVQRTTRSIPVVALHVTDPVLSGFAQTLARPGGNMTGVLWADPTFSEKSVHVLKETIPAIQRIGTLASATSGAEKYADRVDKAARDLGVTMYRFYIAHPGEIGAALSAMKKERIDALRVSYEGAMQVGERQIREFAASEKMPDFWTLSGPVVRGGFMSYSPKVSDTVARGAALVDQILKGAKPAELPFEYPTQYDLVVNLKTARERGIKVPPSILVRATRVIE